MDKIFELDRNLASSPDEGIKIYEGSNAMNERIMEWLETPEGEMMDMPAWGHPLKDFKHEPTGGLNSNLEVMAEMTIWEKLLDDIDDLDLKGIAVDFPEIDMMHIVIQHSNTLLDTTVPL